MAHKEQKEFISNVYLKFKDNFYNKDVLEVGSLNINGTVRDYFFNCNYTGIDIGAGDGVDVVCEGQNFNAADASFDTIISCECFEHNPYWKETFLNMIRMCKNNGLIIFTCATTGRPEHGTSKTTPKSSPLTVLAGWDYYKNLTEADFTSIENFSSYFTSFKFDVNLKSKDLYFWGIRGVR